MRYYILAGTNEQAREIARKMDLARTEWNYVSCTDVLRGIYDMPLLTYGTWRERTDSPRIIELAKERRLPILYIDT